MHGSIVIWNGETLKERGKILWYKGKSRGYSRYNIGRAEQGSHYWFDTGTTRLKDKVWLQ